MSDEIADDVNIRLLEAMGYRREYQIINLFPVDHRGHIADCGYYDSGECMCLTLPDRIATWLAEHDRQVRAAEREKVSNAYEAAGPWREDDGSTCEHPEWEHQRGKPGWWCAWCGAPEPAGGLESASATSEPPV